MILFFLFVIEPRPPGFTRPCTLFPFTTRLRSEIKEGGPAAGRLPGGRPKGIRTRRPLSFGVRCFLVWEKTFLLRGGVPASRVGPAAAIPGKLARFVPTFLTDAAETPRKNLRLDRHRSEEHTSELQSLMRISYAVFCLKKKKQPLATPMLHTQSHQH